jgi:hypothetical protein
MSLCHSRHSAAVWLSWSIRNKVVVHKADGTTEARDFALPEGKTVLDPDVRVYFADSEAVHRTLRELIHLIPDLRLPDEATG